MIMSRAINPKYGTSDWRNLRHSTLASSGYTCHICGGIAETAHHVSYKRGIICDQRWLRALCWRCHRMIHGVLERPKFNNG
jgi:hypothetical protein